MTQLQKAVEDYVAIRRNMGFKFEDAAKLLGSFVRQLEQDGSPRITTAASAWRGRLAHGSGEAWVRLRDVGELRFPIGDGPHVSLLP